MNIKYDVAFMIQISKPKIMRVVITKHFSNRIFFSFSPFIFFNARKQIIKFVIHTYIQWLQSRVGSILMDHNIHTPQKIHLDILYQNIALVYIIISIYQYAVAFCTTILLSFIISLILSTRIFNLKQLSIPFAKPNLKISIIGQKRL